MKTLGERALSEDPKVAAEAIQIGEAWHRLLRVECSNSSRPVGQPPATRVEVTKSGLCVSVFRDCPAYGMWSFEADKEYPEEMLVAHYSRVSYEPTLRRFIGAIQPTWWTVSRSDWTDEPGNVLSHFLGEATAAEVVAEWKPSSAH